MNAYEHQRQALVDSTMRDERQMAEAVEDLQAAVRPGRLGALVVAEARKHRWLFVAFVAISALWLAVRTAARRRLAALLARPRRGFVLELHRE